MACIIGMVFGAYALDKISDGVIYILRAPSNLIYSLKDKYDAYQYQQRHTNLEGQIEEHRKTRMKIKEKYDSFLIAS